MREQSTTKGFAVLSMAGIVVKLLSLFYVPLLIGIIGTEGYGIYAAAYEAFSFIYILTNTGMQTAISKLVAELVALNNSKDAVRTFKIARTMLVVLGVAMSIILAIFSGPIAKMTSNEQSYFAILCLSPAILLTTVLASYRGYFQGRSVMTPTAISQIIEQLINVIFSLMFAKLLINTGGVIDGAAGGTIGTVVGALIAGIYLIHKYKKIKFVRKTEVEDTDVKRLSTKQIVRKLFKYGAPITISAGLQYWGNITDLLLVKNRLLLAGLTERQGNIKYGMLGQYKSLIGVPLAIITALSASIIPSISRAVALGNKKALKEKINFTFKMSYMISIPCAVGFAVLSKEIYKMLYPGNVEGYKLLMYGSALVVLMSIVQIQTVILQCTNRFYPVLASLSVGVICKFILNYALVADPDLNINGVMIANAAWFGVPMLINNEIMKKSLKVKVGLFREALKPTLSAMIMGLAVKLINDQLHFIFSKIGTGYLMTVVPTLISVGIGAIVYGYAMVLTGGITEKDFKVLPARFTKIIPNFIKKRLK